MDGDEDEEDEETGILDLGLILTVSHALINQLDAAPHTTCAYALLHAHAPLSAHVYPMLFGACNAWGVIHG